MCYGILGLAPCVCACGTGWKGSEMARREICHQRRPVRLTLQLPSSRLCTAQPSTWQVRYPISHPASALLSQPIRLSRPPPSRPTSIQYPSPPPHPISRFRPSVSPSQPLTPLVGRSVVGPRQFRARQAWMPGYWRLSRLHCTAGLSLIAAHRSVAVTYIVNHAYSSRGISSGGGEIGDDASLHLC